jgi:antagonist of KipI
VDVPVLLGSRATLITAGFGGHQGRPLRGDDRLSSAMAVGEAKRRTARPGVLPPYAEEQTLRVVSGPQADAFSGAARTLFCSSPYVVSQRSDRMGIRLEGPSIDRVKAADLAPEGLAPGTIQVPADGQPIVLGADRPTTGGYTKIATVVTADLGQVAQAKPGDRLRFSEVSVEEARRLWQQREELLASVIRVLS